MKKILIFGAIIGLLLSTLVFSACLYNANLQSRPVTSGSILTTTYAKWWEKFGQPEYGGELIIAYSGMLEDVNFGPDTAGGQTQLWEETLFIPDWNTDRNDWSFQLSYIPSNLFACLLAESWEQTDPLTVIVYLRQGIHWWDRPPVNGRELTAADIAYNYAQVLGVSGISGGSGGGLNLSDIESVTSRDTYTIEFKMKNLSVHTLPEVFSGVNIAPPELFEMKAEYETNTTASSESSETGIPEVTEEKILRFDISEAIGTGPWTPIEYDRYSYITYERNPDYWGCDEHYTENKVPYIDSIKYISIMNAQTLEGALRTGKVDISSDGGGMTWQQAVNLQQTNKTINVAWVKSSGYDVEMRVDCYPFTDIRVRQAMSMAIDRDGISYSIWGGSTDGKPSGMISPVYQGYAFAYEDWPDELKEVYSYNPTKAKQLLAEAGIASLETNCKVSNSESPDLLMILKYEFQEIGIDMKIIQVDAERYTYTIMSGQHDQMCLDRRTGMTDTPYSTLTRRLSTAKSDYSRHGDTEYDVIVEKFLSATTIAEAQQYAVAADRYALEQCWTINICSMASPVVWQPYLKGYSGESLSPYYGYYYARWWIDNALK